MKNTTLIFSRKIFDHEKIVFCKTFFSISIQKVSRNPKIILRTPCDHFKDTKNIASKKILISADIVAFYVALPLSRNDRKYRKCRLKWVAEYKKFFLPPSGRLIFLVFLTFSDAFWEVVADISGWPT